LAGREARLDAPLMPPIIYEISSAVWVRAVRLADRGRAAGVAVPLAGLLVFACANVHGLDLAHDDAHFGQLATFAGSVDRLRQRTNRSSQG